MLNLSNLSFTIAAFVVALGVLIVIHEFGHFLVARRCGVKVLRFSIGFGKPLWYRKFGRDGTELALAAFPVGGYVKMLDEREGEVAPEELHRAFTRQSVGRRMLIVGAGPTANFLLAVALYWLLFVHGVPGAKPILGDVPPATAAAAAQFEAGDLIASLDGEPVRTWQDVSWLLVKKAIDKAPVKVETENDRGEIRYHVLETASLLQKELESDFLEKLGLTHYRIAFRAVVGDLTPGDTGQLAGLKSGDEILAVGGHKVADWNVLVATVRADAGIPLSFEIRRDGAPLALADPNGVGEHGKPVGKIGAAPWLDPALEKKLMTEVRYGPVRAFGEAVGKTWDTSVFTLQTLGKMVLGEISLKNISGPITIADYAGRSAHGGWLPYLSFLAAISISLGVLNLLPVPLLDGGHLMYYMAEIVMGRPVSERAMEIGQRIGMVLLLTLMAFAFYNDLNRLL